jgi:hypothetical protein
MPTPEEFKALSDFISNVGFPIAAYVGMFFALAAIVRLMIRTGEKLSDRLIAHFDATDKSQAEMAAALPNICKSSPCAAAVPQAKPA